MPTDIDTSDEIVWVSHLPAELKPWLGGSTPKHRDLVRKSNDAELEPLMERHGRFWGCRRRNLPQLIAVLRGAPDEQADADRGQSKAA
jgi:hypothetical protein